MHKTRITLIYSFDCDAFIFLIYRHARLLNSLDVNFGLQLVNELVYETLKMLHFLVINIVLLHKLEEVDAGGLGVELRILMLHFVSIVVLPTEIIVTLVEIKRGHYRVFIIIRLPFILDGELIKKELEVVSILLEIGKIDPQYSDLVTILGRVDLTPALRDFEHHTSNLRIEVIFYLNRSPNMRCG